MIEALTLRWWLPAATTTLADAAVVAPVGLVPWAPPVAWQTGAAYVADPPASVVAFDGEGYVCLTAHTAGVFADDLAAGKWLLISPSAADAKQVLIDAGLLAVDATDQDYLDLLQQPANEAGATVLAQIAAAGDLILDPTTGTLKAAETAALATIDGEVANSVAAAVAASATGPDGDLYVAVAAGVTAVGDQQTTSVAAVAAAADLVLDPTTGTLKAAETAALAAVDGEVATSVAAAVAASATGPDGDLYVAAASGVAAAVATSAAPGGDLAVAVAAGVTAVGDQQTTSVAAVAAAADLVLDPTTGTLKAAETAALAAVDGEAVAGVAAAVAASAAGPSGDLYVGVAAGVATVDAEATAQATALGDLGAAQAASVAAAAAAGPPYADTTAGLAATTSGDYFLTVGDGTNTYALLYLNNSGSADLLASYPDAAALTAAVASINSSVRWVGQPAPITGTAAGNSTYILGDPCTRKETVDQINGFGLSAGGDVYIKALDDSTGAWTGRALATVTLPADATTIDVNLDLEPGERLAVWGQNIIPLVANGGGLTGYYTLAGNVLTGAIGAAVTNSAVQIGFRLVSRRGDADATADAQAARTSDARLKDIGLADADLGSSLSSSTAYYDPRPRPAGTPDLLNIWGRTAGWCTLVLDAPDDESETKWTRYFQMPILLDVGKTSITRGDSTAGRGFPLDLVLRDGTIAGVICPSAGGQVAYTSTDGPNPVGENLIGYRLPQGSFQGNASGGTRALTFSATSNRQIAWEWQITEIASPRKLASQRQMFADVGFAGTSLPRDLYAQGTVPTFNAGYAQSNATGFGNNLRQRFGHCFDRQRRRAVLQFGDAASKIVADIRPVGGSYGTSVMADVAANQVTVYVGHGAVSSTPAASAGFPVAWPGTFDAANSQLVFDFTRNGRTFGVTVTDVGVQPVVSWSHEVDVSAADIPPASGGTGTESASLQLMGQLNGCLGSLAIAGSVKTLDVLDGSPRRGIRGVIVGDSISNASRCDYADGWAPRLQAELAAIGIEVAIIAIDGLDMPGGAKNLSHALTLLPDLEWAILALGTNRSSADETRETNMFQASAQAALYELQAGSIEPYFMVPAPHTFSPGAATQATRLAWLQTTAFTLIRGDLSLTQADGVTIDGTLFYGGGSGDVHPIAAGQANLLARVKLDAPKIWY